MQELRIVDSSLNAASLSAERDADAVRGELLCREGDLFVVDAYVAAEVLGELRDVLLDQVTTRLIRPPSSMLPPRMNRTLRHRDRNP